MWVVHVWIVHVRVALLVVAALVLRIIDNKGTGTTATPKNLLPNAAWDDPPMAVGVNADTVNPTYWSLSVDASSGNQRMRGGTPNGGEPVSILLSEYGSILFGLLPRCDMPPTTTNAIHANTGCLPVRMLHLYGSVRMIPPVTTRPALFPSVNNGTLAVMLFPTGATVPGPTLFVNDIPPSGDWMHFGPIALDIPSLAHSLTVGMLIWNQSSTPGALVITGLRLVDNNVLT